LGGVAKTDPARVHPDVAGFTPETLSVKAELSGPMKRLASFALGDLTIETRKGRDTLWFLIRRPGKGGLALRAIPATGPVTIGARRETKSSSTWPVESASGLFTVKLELLGDMLLRMRVSLKPRSDLLVAFWPRDLYPIDAHDDPTGAEGWVEAAQRGLNTGLCYLCLDKPKFGSALYVQNLTALNPYFAATKTKPDGVVGGEWPELGYQPPTAPMGSSPPIHPLRKGEEVVISDALISLRAHCRNDETASARQFVDMLAEIYPHLDKPEPQFRDWITRSEKTISDLERAPEATIEHYGHTYIHPYTASEYPDSMVQLSVTAALKDYARAQSREIDLADTLMAGMGRFFDKELGVVRRYLPNVGADKIRDAVDSWYLYHPLMNLGRLALRGDKLARKLFLDSMAYAIKAAKHFNYVWPIQYDVRDFSIITKARSEDGFGQTDVGGLYAYVMLLAYELTDESKYLGEAKAALEALKGVRFELAYQTNLTAWGAVACARLWRLEKNQGYIDQSLIFVANFLHNCELWDSQIEQARHYPNFFGVTCLHDAPYMAAYECFESFAAFDEYLEVGGQDIPSAARFLLNEYRRFTPDRGWFFYPDALPQEAVAKDKIRNGHIDRHLSFPLEDLYGDGQPAGQVGQEIYGCGGAFIFAARCFHECADAPFRIFTDYPAIVERESASKDILVRLQGPAGQMGRVRLLRKARRAMPRVRLHQDGVAEATLARQRSADFRDFALDADGVFKIKWSPAPRAAR
jgi:hypothetical protein